MVDGQTVSTHHEIGHVYLTERILQVVLQKSIPAQIRQLILDISNKEYVNGFMRELTFAKRL